MALEILNFILGPLENNSYLIACSHTGEAAIIDPSFGSETMLDEVIRRGWTVRHIWLTHAHFDHIAGVGSLTGSLQHQVSVAIHPNDHELWKRNGGASQFGFQIQPIPVPTEFLTHGQILHLGQERIEVRHTPGHTSGHVMFYSPSARACFCGDLIFQGSVGRTDLPGGDFDTLLESIRTQVLTLPPQTHLFSGHGPVTTVADESRENPFLA